MQKSPPLISAIGKTKANKLKPEIVSYLQGLKWHGPHGLYYEADVSRLADESSALLKSTLQHLDENNELGSRHIRFPKDTARKLEAICKQHKADSPWLPEHLKQQLEGAIQHVRQSGDENIFIPMPAKAARELKTSLKAFHNDFQAAKRPSQFARHLNSLLEHIIIADSYRYKGNHLILTEQAMEKLGIAYAPSHFADEPDAPEKLEKPHRCHPIKTPRGQRADTENGGKHHPPVPHGSGR